VVNLCSMPAPGQLYINLLHIAHVKECHLIKHFIMSIYQASCLWPRYWRNKFLKMILFCAVMCETFIRLPPLRGLVYVLWHMATKYDNLLESVTILFLKVMQLCKPIFAAWTSKLCFKHSERVQTTTKALWHKYTALEYLRASPRV